MSRSSDRLKLTGLPSDSLQITELTPQQIEEIREIFELYDRNGDKTITVNDLGTCMRAIGQHPTEAELRAIIAEIDADGNGIIEFPEFVDLMQRRPWGMLGSSEELSQAFECMKDESGYMSVALLRHLLTTEGEKLTDEQLDESLSKIDVDGDGNIRCEDFVKMMMQPK